MSDGRKYVRVYYDLIKEFPSVYRNDAALACWLRLLMTADAMWPMTPELPRTTRSAPLAVLVEAGLVTVTGPEFTIRGLEAERGRRSDSARIGAAKRWHSDGNANAMPSKDEQSKAKQRRDEGPRDGLPNLDREALEALEKRTGHTASQAGEKQLSEYDRLVGDHGLVPTLAAFDAVSRGQRMTARQLVWGAVKLLEPFVDPKSIAKVEREAEADLTSRRRLDATQAYLRELRGEAS